MGSQKGQMGHRLSNPLQEDSSTKASGSVSKMAHLCDWQVGAGFLLFSRYDSSQSCLGFLTAWQQGFKKEIQETESGDCQFLKSSAWKLYNIISTIFSG